MTTRFWRTIVLLLSFALVAGACGDDDDTAVSGDAASETTDTTVAPEGEDVDDGASDEAIAIVSLSPTATEMLFAIGAGDLVIAADDFSNYPEEAPTTDLSGFTPNVEAIADFEPTHVIGSFLGDDVVSGLEALDITVAVYGAATTLDDTYQQLRDLGALTGHEDDADAVVEQIQSDLDEIAALVADRDEPLTYYYELDNTFYSVTSSTFIGEIMGLAGMTSIADAVGDSSGGFPQLSEEYIISANPDVILNACSKFCGVSADDIAGRAGWDTIAAVQNGLVVDLDDDIASRWGPRIVDLLDVVVKATANA